MSRVASAGLILVLLLATVGEGGAAPPAMRVWHAALVALLVALVLLPSNGRWAGRSAAAGPSSGLALFAGIVLAGSLPAPSYSAWLLLLELGAFLAVFALAARCGPRLARWLAPALLVGGAAQAAVVFLTPTVPPSRPAGTFLNPNHLAGWLGAALLLAAAEGLLGHASRGRRVMTLGLGLPVAAALVASGSRGALVGIAIGGMTLVALLRKRLGRTQRWLAAALALLALVAGSVVLARRLGEADPFRYQRVAIWRASLQTVLEAPWSGSGPRRFAHAARNLQFPDGDGPLRYDRGFTAPHSDLLRAPCEFGWPGAAALLLTVLAVVRVLRSRHRERPLGQIECGAVAALVALVAQSAVDNLSHRPALYLLAAALLGSLVSRPVAPAARIGWKPRLGLAALLLVVFVVGDEAPYRAWRETAGPHPAGDGPTAALDRLDRALSWNPVNPAYWRGRAAWIAADASGWNLQRYTEAREAAERAVRLSPQDSDAYWILARIEALACRTLFRDVASRERARRGFEQAERLSRYNAILPLTLARFLLDTGDAAGARRAAERALALEPESVQPRLVLAEALLAGADPRSAVRAAALLAQAEERAKRWADHADAGIYARALLRPERRGFERLRSMLEPRPGQPVDELTEP